MTAPETAPRPAELLRGSPVLSIAAIPGNHEAQSGTVVAMGGTHAGFKATTKIDRFDYNLKWSKATESGGMVAGKEVEITINADFKKS